MNFVMIRNASSHVSLIFRNSPPCPLPAFCYQPRSPFNTPIDFIGGCICQGAEKNRFFLTVNVTSAWRAGSAVPETLLQTISPCFADPFPVAPRGADRAEPEQKESTGVAAGILWRWQVLLFRLSNLSGPFRVLKGKREGCKIQNEILYIGRFP